MTPFSYVNPQKNVPAGQLVGVLGPVSHKGLYQGCLWDRTLNPSTHSLTLSSPQHSLKPDTAAGSTAEGEAVGMPPNPGEDSGLRLGKRASDSDGMTKEMGTQKELCTSIGMTKEIGTQKKQCTSIGMTKEIKTQK